MKRILLAYDGSEPARRALAQTIQLAVAFSAHVGVVSVVPTAASSRALDPWESRTVHADELLEARATLRQAGIEPELFEPSGDPARSIERIAREGGFDTVVMGSRGLTGIARALSGSVSDHVATHARATVVVTR
jgi:nucleotide-binding universal stress UspA family protein